MTDEEKLKNAILAMNLGLATAAATGVGVYYVYGEKGKVAAVSAIVTGVVLYAAYWMKLKSNPKINGFMNGGLGKTSSDTNGTNKTNTTKVLALDTQSNTSWKPLSQLNLNNIKNLTAIN